MLLGSHYIHLVRSDGDTVGVFLKKKKPLPSESILILINEMIRCVSRFTLKRSRRRNNTMWGAHGTGSGNIGNCLKADEG